MRYKALSPSQRAPLRPDPPRRAIERAPSPGQQVRDWIGTGIILVLIPALLIPAAIIGAARPSLAATPNRVAPGATVVVVGTNFPKNERGYLAFDGDRLGMPEYRVSRSGEFRASMVVPLSAAAGEHVVSAVSQPQANSGKPHRNPTAAGVVATVVLAVALVQPSSPPIPPPAPPAPTATTGPSPSPAPTAPPAAGSWQPSFPVRAAFYYPWFPEAWDQGGIDPFTRYHPSLGRYDGGDQSVIQNHIAAMQYGNISVGIASWWGQGSRTDGRISSLLGATGDRQFRWTVYYEPEGQGDPSVEQIRADLGYLRDRYASSPAFYRAAGKFVVFVYADGNDGCATAARWAQANATIGAYVVLKVFSGYRTCASQPDGWHQYAPAVAVDAQDRYSFSISPGFHLANESVRLARDLVRWNENVRQMAASGADFQLVTTFNEWGEGTSVESATEWASASGYGAYLDALHANGVGGAPPPSVPVPTAAPTLAPPPPTPTTAPPPSGGSAVLVGAGDIAGCATSGDEATAALLDGIQGTVFTTGDNVYDNGTLAEFNACYAPSWGRHKARTTPAPGNHDWHTANAQGYRDYFGFGSGPLWYSYNLGTWHVVVLDSNCSNVGGCGVGSAQHTWLVNDLAADTSACTVALWHHPRWSSGEHGPSTATAPFWSALHADGAELVVNGHDHTYERFAPQNPSGAADPQGIREFVVGTGGKNLYAFATVAANSEVRHNQSFGVLKLTLDPGGYSWQFVSQAGATFTDSGTATCH